MKNLQRKLRSRRGASISFALLLFLVCAVVGSVVLVAGTAAAGRVSQTAEFDQRYYSVTSAAELLRGMIEWEDNDEHRDNVVTIVKVDMTKYDEDGTAKDPDEGTPTINGVEISNPDNPSFSSIIEDAAYQIWSNNTSVNRNYSISVALSGEDDTDFSGLNVNVTEALSKQTIVSDVLEQWMLAITISDTANKYTLRLTFYAQVDGDVDEKYETDEDTGEEVKVTTKTQTVTWSLATIQTVGGTVS